MHMHTTALLPLLAMLAREPVQWTTSCRGPNPRLERLAKAVEAGAIEVVRAELHNGLDPNEPWRDLPGSTLCRSLLLRSVWYLQEDIFRLVLERGGDVRTLPRESIQTPVREGRIEMARTLFALGLKPHDDVDIVRAGLESKQFEMIDLLASSGVPVNASSVALYQLTDDLTRFLVPKYLKPNDSVGLGMEPCAVAEIFDLLSDDQDGCEAPTGPLWLHFVVIGNHQMVEFMIENGADLTLGSDVFDNSDVRPFTAMDVAARRKDKRMIDVLRRAGATARRFRERIQDLFEQLAPIIHGSIRRQECGRTFVAAHDQFARTVAGRTCFLAASPRSRSC
jgi:hypothetical protein